MKKVRKEDVVVAGLTHGSVPADSSVVGVFDSRETFAFDPDRKRWRSQNDDLGAKLDAILVAQNAQLVELTRQSEFLELIAEALARGN